MVAGAVDRYRAAMADSLPYVTTDDFVRDVEAATDLWSVVYSSWFLPRALEADPVRPDLEAPTRRALLLHRLDRTWRESPTPVIASFAASLRGVLAMDLWMFVLSGLGSTMAGAEMGVTIAVVVVAVLLVWLANSADKKGWLG